MKLRALQIKSVRHAKIEHIISKCSVNQKVHFNDRDEHEHMFTYPFRTVDNSLHGSRKDWLNSVITQEQTVCMMPYMGKNDIASSIIIDKNWLGLLLLDVTCMTSLSVSICLGKPYISHSPLCGIVF